MGWKKMIFGEKMPDKHDPQYKERYEREVDAGPPPKCRASPTCTAPCS